MPAECGNSSSGESGSNGSCGRSHEVIESFTQSLAEPSGINQGNGMFLTAPLATGHMVMDKPGMLPHGMNIGTEYWNGPAVPTGHESLRPQYVLAPAAGTMPFNGGTKGSGEMWSQDDKEQKKEKRKQANRESARRSRMRKQFEYEELAEKVALLTAENDSLKSEVNRLGDLYRKLSSDKNALLTILKIWKSCSAQSGHGFAYHRHGYDVQVLAKVQGRGKRLTLCLASIRDPCLALVF